MHHRRDRLRMSLPHCERGYVLTAIRIGDCIDEPFRRRQDDVERNTQSAQRLASHAGAGDRPGPNGCKRWRGVLRRWYSPAAGPASTRPRPLRQPSSTSPACARAPCRPPRWSSSRRRSLHRGCRYLVAPISRSGSTTETVQARDVASAARLPHAGHHLLSRQLVGPRQQRGAGVGGGQ